MNNRKLFIFVRETWDMAKDFDLSHSDLLEAIAIFIINVARGCEMSPADVLARLQELVSKLERK